MEYDEREFKPNLTLNFLQQQVEEQTEVCDLTLKMGQWERKYHRCVLKESPFFDCILKNDFLEKHTGIINVTGWTPSCIDMVLMYLYGEEPKLSDKNIEAIFDLAEFFMIPNLKSACVNWLNAQHISCGNCLSFLQLSSIYEFELPQCITFIESHLNEVLEQQLCISLTYESIYYIFKKETLRYLHMEQRLLFLIRWYKAQPENRRQWVEKLLQTIAFHEIPTSCLHKIKRDQVAEKMLHDVDVNFQYVDEKFDVLINNTSKNGVILCFDFRRNALFKITSAALKGALRVADVVGTNSEVSELLLVRDINQQHTTLRLSKLHLDNDALKTYDVVYKDSGTVLNSFSVFHYSNNLCVICQKDRYFMKQLPVQKMAMEGDHRNSIIVLIGKIVDDKVEMVPQFSIPDCAVLSVATNKSSVVALLLNSGEYVLLYDTVECTLNKLKIKTEQGDNIFSTDNGFVIHNNKRCITIRSVSGHALSKRYKAYEYNLPNDEVCHVFETKYYFCNNIWYRRFYDLNHLRPHFQCVDHDMVEKASSLDSVKWTELTLPREDSNISLFGKLIYFVKIPRLIQQCHIQCPHCKK